MGAIPYMPLYVADYMADAAHLSTLQHGAYLLLIMTYWQRGKPLPNDDEMLARICRLSKRDFARNRAVLLSYFQEMKNTLVHSRIEGELAKVRAKSLKCKQARLTIVKRTPDDRSTDVQRTFNHTDTDTDIKKGSLMENPKKERFLGSDEPKPDQIEVEDIPEFLDRRPKPDKPPDEILEAVEAWNAMAHDAGLAKVERVTPSRKASLRKRLDECGGMEGWRSALTRVRSSPFLLGDNAKGWRADFDFILQAKSFTKLMEGGYDARPAHNTKPKPTLDDDRRAIAEGIFGDAGGVESSDDAAGGPIVENDFGEPVIRRAAVAAD